jgi:hypothetical protein
MFWQFRMALCVADDEGVAAALTDLALTAVVVVPDDVVAAEVVCAVAALATARLPPTPTPSAPAPIAVPMMILLSRVFNVSRLLAIGRWSWAKDTRASWGRAAPTLSRPYETLGRRPVRLRGPR